MADTAYVIDKPGVYDGIPNDVYQADPVLGGSLSSSGARRLLPPSCPALYRHWRDHGQPPKPEFDIGHAAHLMVLGAGPELVVVDAPDWRTKAAREQRDAAHESGKVPVLAADHERVHAMATALRDHPVAAALFDPTRGKPEQTLVWVDQDTGVWRRARPDWLPNPGTGRMVVPDYKTCRSASPEAIQRSIHEYGYHCQAAFYTDGVRSLGLASDPAFVLVFQEVQPPHLVTVAQPDAVAMRIGRSLNRHAIDLYAECTAADRWPGFSDDVELIGLPPWAEARHLEEIGS